MSIIISQKQLDKINDLFPSEDIDFVKAWKKKTGHYPKFRELQQSGKKINDLFIPTKVGEIITTHSKKNITTKTYVDRHLGKILKYIVGKLKLDSGEPFKKGSRAEKKYVSSGAKEVLRSELEVLTYNIFVLENVSDEIEVDSKRFKKSCGGKEPDFVWENKKIIIEIAGMEGDEYIKKLKVAKQCFQNLGYTVYVIDARPFEKQGKYVEYYTYICDLLGFKPKDEVINSPYKYLGYNEVNRAHMQKYIDNNIDKIPYDATQRYNLNKYINQIYGYGVKEYKRRNELKRFRHSVNKNEIRKYKSENPTLSNQEIAIHFGVSKNTVQQATKK